MFETLINQPKDCLFYLLTLIISFYAGPYRPLLNYFWLFFMFLWLKAFHIISIVCWFAALFYLPRLFVYHADALDNLSNERFKVMERKLYKGIATPSAFLTVFFGGWLLMLQPEYYLSSTWMLIKLGLVVLLIIYHLLCGYFVRVFQQNKNQHPHVFYRWFNEFPVILLISIILLVVLKPF